MNRKIALVTLTLSLKFSHNDQRSWDGKHYDEKDPALTT